MTEELETLRSSSLGSRTLVGLGLEAAFVLLCGCQWLLLDVSSVMREAPVRPASLFLFNSLWLCGVFVAVQAAVSLCCVASRCGGSPVGPGLSRSAAGGVFPDQGSKPRPLHWQVDSHHPQPAPCQLSGITGCFTTTHLFSKSLLAGLS